MVKEAALMYPANRSIGWDIVVTEDGPGFIEGNHDRYTGISTIKQYLKEINVHVLENEMTTWNDLQIICTNMR